MNRTLALTLLLLVATAAAVLIVGCHLGRVVGRAASQALWCLFGWF